MVTFAVMIDVSRRCKQIEGFGFSKSPVSEKSNSGLNSQKTEGEQCILGRSGRRGRCRYCVKLCSLSW